MELLELKKIGLEIKKKWNYLER